MRSFFNRTLAFLALIALTACGGDTTETTPTPEAPASAEVADTPVAPATLSGSVENGVRTLRITPVGDQMLFEQTELAVAAGETVRIVFENTATSPAMQHNVLLLSDRDAVNRVGIAALEAAASDYVPEDEAILAATPLAQPGQTVEVTFTAPETPGAYVYVCTFPGHYMMMQGTLTVVAAPAI